MLRIGIIGAGFIARPHVQGLRALREIWGSALPGVELAAVCDERPELAQAFADRFGIPRVAGDWHELTGDPRLDAVLVLVPNDLHVPIALDALAHGKHVLCEKPLAPTAAAAADLVRAALEAGTVAQVAFAYRCWPAVQHARDLVATGEIGEVVAFRGRFLHDYGLDPAHPYSWRFSRARAGAGALGDLGSHVIDLARVLVGEIAGVAAARTRTLIAERADADGRRQPVDVDDAAELWLDFDTGATGAIDVGWAAAGHRTDIAFELHGRSGALSFAWGRGGRLELWSGRGPEGLEGGRTVELGPHHPGALWPVPGIGMGWGEAFVLTAREFVRAIAGEPAGAATFYDGLRAAEVVEAAQAVAAAAPAPEPIRRPHR
ncbi:MAG TPA: Gfo/Idh/MocA family oxidoreductase [Solirubrobacter sp.]|nr:Gfo/Idh/MocA family oxidoreductase [Solirubrobacter sp.]